MRDFWTRSLPALIVLFVCFFGFTIITMSSGNPCDYLRWVAVEATTYAETACEEHGNGAVECRDAQSDAFRAWASFFNAGCNY